VTASPDRVVLRSIHAFNVKDPRSLLSTIDPAKESLALEIIKQVNPQDGISLDTAMNVLPGLIQLIGNPLPDEWRLDDAQVVDRKEDDDLAWVTVSATLTTRVRDQKTKDKKRMRFALHKFESVGWRIVDLQLQTAG
jgi:hypothetical protein